ncbi:MAG: cation diffusion facilitator family transporter [Spirochaetes bacterium]|nr:cation diffusion facilitator family transporter [Spirochaetota bacterium]
MKTENRIKLIKGKRIALLASLITVLLAAGKYIIGVYFNSEVLTADAVHSFADTAAILLSAFGLHLAGRPKNSRFPYGLYKAETISLLFVGLFIGYAGIDLFIEGVSSIRSPSAAVELQMLPMITAVISIIVSVFIAAIELRTSKEVKSLSLEANAKESFMDIITSVIVLAGIILPSYNIPYIEGGVVILISLIVFKIGAENTVHSILVLLDADINKDIKDEIKECVNTIKGIKLVNQIMIRETGPFKMVEMEILTSPSATVFVAGRIGDEIRNNIYNNFSNIEHIFIDIKPARNEIYHAVIPVEENNGLDSRVSRHFGKSKYFIIIRIDEEKSEIEDFYLNEFLDKPRHIGLNVIKSIAHYNIDIIFTMEIGEISFHILRDNLIDIYKIPDYNITAKKVVEEFKNKNLEKIIKPTHASDEPNIQ